MPIDQMAGVVLRERSPPWLLGMMTGVSKRGVRRWRASLHSPTGPAIVAQ